METLPAEEYNYNILTGVSAGSMNAGGLGLFERGNEPFASNWLTDFWLNMTADDVYTIKPDIPYDFFFGNSFADNAPLRQTLSVPAHKFGEHRHVMLGTTNLDNGEFMRFRNFNTTLTLD